MGYTKKQAVSIVTKCAKSYKENLVSKSLVFICSDKHKRIFVIESAFDVSNFLHLTGFKLKETTDKDGNKYKLSAIQFFNSCLDGKLRFEEFDFAPDGTTALKLDVLPMVINKNLSASMIGV